MEAMHHGVGGRFSGSESQLEAYFMQLPVISEVNRHRALSLHSLGSMGTKP